MYFSLLMACLHTAPEPPPFVCEGPPPPPTGDSLESTPLGLVSVQSSSPPINWSGWRAAPTAPVASVWGVQPQPAPPQTQSPQAWFNEQAVKVRLSLLADAAPLHQLALALGQNLSMDVLVSEAAGNLLVSALYNDTSLATVLQMLRIEHGVTIQFDDGTLSIDVPTPACSWCDLPLEVAMLDATVLPAPRTVAAVFCQDIASPRGSAAVIGDQLYIRDIPEAVQALQDLYSTVQVSETDDEM